MTFPLFRTKRTMVLSSFVLLVLFMAACNGANSPAAATEESATTADTVDVDLSLDMEDPNAFTELAGNYEIKMDFNFTADVAGSTLYREFVIDGYRSVAPEAFSYVMTPNEPEIMDNREFMHLVYLDGISYVYAPNLGCQQYTYSEFTSPFENLVRDSGIFIGEVKLVGSGEIVNGLATDIYEITTENISSESVASLNYSVLEKGFLYLEQESHALVRLLLSGEGTSETMSGDPALTGKLVYQIDFVPTNDIPMVQSPEACEEEETTNTVEWPAMANAENAGFYSGLYVYSTESPLDLILDFYFEEMEALGFSVVRNDVNDEVGSADLFFYHEDQGVVQVAIQRDGSGKGYLIAVGQP